MQVTYFTRFRAARLDSSGSGFLTESFEPSSVCSVIRISEGWFRTSSCSATRVLTPRVLLLLPGLNKVLSQEVCDFVAQFQTFLVLSSIRILACLECVGAHL
jgi:hypothetical protein